MFDPHRGEGRQDVVVTLGEDAADHQPTIRGGEPAQIIGKFDERRRDAGDDLLRLSPASMRALRGHQMGMIFQEPMTSLNPAYTVGDQIAESVRKHLGLDRKAAMARATSGAMAEARRIIEPAAAEIRTLQPGEAFFAISLTYILPSDPNARPTMAVKPSAKS